MDACSCAPAWITAATALVGLGLLIWYAVSTHKIAIETARHGDILSKPAITIRLKTNRDSSGRSLGMARVGTLVDNHSLVHAKIKIRLEAHLKKADSEVPIVFKAPYPYNGEVWPFPAKLPFQGGFTFIGLENVKLAEGDKLFIDGWIESSPYDVDNYRRDPFIPYLWYKDDEKWVPYAYAGLPKSQQSAD